jgi:hypothetical protein
MEAIWLLLSVSSMKNSPAMSPTNPVVPIAGAPPAMIEESPLARVPSLPIMDEDGSAYVVMGVISLIDICICSELVLYVTAIRNHWFETNPLAAVFTKPYAPKSSLIDIVSVVSAVSTYNAM